MTLQRPVERHAAQHAEVDRTAQGHGLIPFPRHNQIAQREPVPAVLQAALRHEGLTGKPVIAVAARAQAVAPGAGAQHVRQRGVRHRELLPAQVRFVKRIKAVEAPAPEIHTGVQAQVGIVAAARTGIVTVVVGVIHVAGVAQPQGIDPVIPQRRVDHLGLPGHAGRRLRGADDQLLHRLVVSDPGVRPFFEEVVAGLIPRFRQLVEMRVQPRLVQQRLGQAGRGTFTGPGGNKFNFGFKQNMAVEHDIGGFDPRVHLIRVIKLFRYFLRIFAQEVSVKGAVTGCCLRIRRN
ncbi:hypothetical protein D3C81_1203910 [compost metagenome]